MLKINKITLIHIFQIFIFGAVIISFYLLIDHYFKKSYHNINCWRFPMLLAILLESFII